MGSTEMTAHNVCKEDAPGKRQIEKTSISNCLLSALHHGEEKEMFLFTAHRAFCMEI